MSTCDETYNGWRNVETWRVQLHLANDEQTARVVAAVAGEFALPWLAEPVTGMAEWLRTFVTTRVTPDPETDRDNWAQFSCDVVEAALARVDWGQIAGHWLQVARDELKPVEPAT